MQRLLQLLVKTVFWLAAIGQLADAAEFMKRRAFNASRHGILSLGQLNRGLYPTNNKH
jgi:hypothetical protein